MVQRPSGEGTAWRSTPMRNTSSVRSRERASWRWTFGRSLFTLTRYKWGTKIENVKQTLLFAAQAWLTRTFHAMHTHTHMHACTHTYTHTLSLSDLLAPKGVGQGWCVDGWSPRHIRTHTHTYTHTHHTRIHTHTACTQPHTHVHTYTHAHTHTHTHTAHTHAHMYTHIKSDLQQTVSNPWSLAR